jgi:hypothetical protein
MRLAVLLISILALIPGGILLVSHPPIGVAILTAATLAGCLSAPVD